MDFLSLFIFHFSSTELEVTARIKFLRAARRAEIKSGKMRSGSGASDRKRSKNRWFIGDLSFLDPILHPAPTMDSFTTSTTDGDMVCVQNQHYVVVNGLILLFIVEYVLALLLAYQSCSGMVISNPDSSCIICDICF